MIIKEFIQNGICFTIIQSNSFLTKAKIMHNQEYEILALEIDCKKLQRRFTTNNGFYIPENQKNPEGIVSRTLNLDEIIEFNKLKDEFFIKVFDNVNGRVWELRDKSFKEHYKNYKDGNIRQVS
ncbi:Uncharacterised protein [Chryseobacterium nakagawai]|uniref:Uncharacterized protein n=1 Tax=Chryseobacterium nakagawai TaxID=1241982 RepID=A0AAD0YPK0_CHRNA|nr:hypothetical protein [Chryseobacterium nakagawai]AZA90946.1 hypothetical protein EG343_10010 [Chryseobacterium nakagawai]VEH22485.1 Uncharacterised protein [Chryseobacterium nakagawai]